MQHQLPGGVAEGEEPPELQRHHHSEAAVSGRLAAAGQQVHRRRRQGDRGGMHRAQARSGSSQMHRWLFLDTEAPA